MGKSLGSAATLSGMLAFGLACSGCIHCVNAMANMHRDAQYSTSAFHRSNQRDIGSENIVVTEFVKYDDILAASLSGLIQLSLAGGLSVITYRKLCNDRVKDYVRSSC